MLSFDDHLGAVSLDYGPRLLSERLRIGRGPPVPEVPLGVVAPPLVVEAVGDFMTNHHADGAVVHCIVHSAVEEGGLQYPRREDYLVGGLFEVGVHRGRGHEPLFSVNRPSDPRR